MGWENCKSFFKNILFLMFLTLATAQLFSVLISTGFVWHLLGGALSVHPHHVLQKQMFSAWRSGRKIDVVVVGDEEFVQETGDLFPDKNSTLRVPLPEISAVSIARAIHATRYLDHDTLILQNAPVGWSDLDPLVEQNIDHWVSMMTPYRMRYFPLADVQLFFRSLSEALKFRDPLIDQVLSEGESRYFKNLSFAPDILVASVGRSSQSEELDGQNILWVTRFHARQEHLSAKLKSYMKENEPPVGCFVSWEQFSMQKRSCVGGIR